MTSLLKGKRGLSTVVTTLIILVVSVLLATVVTYYAINMTTTRVQDENLKITKAHIWANDSFTQAAFVIKNIGGRDTLIDKVQVRGHEVAWTTVYYNRTSTEPTTDLTLIDDITTDPDYTNGTADLSLKSGECLIMYLDTPLVISVGDTGSTASLTVFTANAQYKVEVNCQSAS